MHIEWQVLESVIAGLLAGSVGGAITGAIVSHYLAKRRAAEDRKHEAAISRGQRKVNFLAEMQRWRVEIDRLHVMHAGRIRKPSVFLDGVSGFMAATQMIRSDFTGERRTKFDELVAKVAECDAHKTSDILKAIDDLCAYVEAA